MSSPVHKGCGVLAWFHKPRSITLQPESTEDKTKKVMSEIEKIDGDFISTKSRNSLVRSPGFEDLRNPCNGMTPAEEMLYRAKQVQAGNLSD
jgi:hypothetical protein